MKRSGIPHSGKVEKRNPVDKILGIYNSLFLSILSVFCLEF
jgi:hypothetical protein